MKALLFGGPADEEEAPPPEEEGLDQLPGQIPFGLVEVPDARPLRDDWVVTRPILSGICGSDSKLVLGDFGEGDIDNPMAAFASLPNVPGHEVVARVVELGPQAGGLEIGQRVVLNPWLTCLPRGIDPPCPACAAGDLPLCWSFTRGHLGPGVHIGVVADVTGAWAELLAAHRSQWFPVPDGVSDEAAVLADPFAVSLRPILRYPPPAGGRVVVYGAGALGLTSVAILRALHPDVEVAVVARFPAQAAMAERFGASLVLAHEPREEVVQALADWSGATLHDALMGLPMTRPGHIDVVYDTIAKAETLEVGARVLAERGFLVYTGVATPARWEWTPVYFKELTVTGSNAFGIEDLGGLRQHAIAHYLDMAADGRMDITPMVTHRFGLEDWRAALRALARPGDSGALKVAFAPNG
ncbi:MAG TPA: alcohol dehydrogenase catalytic domain-containing protein [Acidimicrobiales bacterium]|jgi:threonine dehydrogenase-like Zn-dependent dehydrogenase|nr:alcohol dehydrogenase catalytic domain-containing protein [Acidimicrobiales bacterium]